MKRPGGGTGGDPWDRIFQDVYDPATPRQTFAHWDAPFVAWLEANKYGVDYTTDLDLHENLDDLLQYRLLISVGHDEYWSEDMRNHIEYFIQNGGNVAFFSGNTCWWRIHLADANTSFTCDKAAFDATKAPFDQWWNGTAKRPENLLTGVSYRNAGGSWAGYRDTVGYTVQHASHWIFEGTGLNDGDQFGDQQDESLVGYECDGAALASQPDAQGFVYPALTDGTPVSFTILGVGQLGGGWNDREAGDNSTATMGIYSESGIMFQAATTDWSRVLAGGNPKVNQITTNVLNRLTSRSLKIVGPGSDCGNNVAVEGQTVKFHTDTSKLPNQGELAYLWTSSSGQPGATDQQAFNLTLSSPPQSVTVTITVTDGAGCDAFGTFTFMPLSLQEYYCLRIACAIREILMLVFPWPRPIEGPGDPARWFERAIGPGGVTRISSHNLREIVRQAARLSDVAHRLLELGSDRTETESSRR